MENSQSMNDDADSLDKSPRNSLDGNKHRSELSLPDSLESADPSPLNESGSVFSVSSEDDLKHINDHNHTSEKNLRRSATITEGVSNRASFYGADACFGTHDGEKKVMNRSSSMQEKNGKGHKNSISFMQRTPRENKTSIERRRLAHITHNAKPDQSVEYSTPWQRKDQVIKELKSDLKETQKALQEKEEMLLFVQQNRNDQIEKIVFEKDEENSELQAEISLLRANLSELENTYEKTCERLQLFETTVKEMQEEMARKEKRHQEIYYKMYMKGQETAKFERQEELAELAKDNPRNVTTHELLEKLQSTQTELERWQCLRRKESYEEAGKLETESEATLRFLKDSMFHYLTNQRDADQHLRAMINMLGYTEVQMKKIRKAMAEKKKKKQ